MGKKKIQANGSQRVKISKSEEEQGQKTVWIVAGCLIVAAIAFIVVGCMM